VRPVTLNQGMPMRAWYDIKSLDRNGIVDEPGIRESMGTVREWIDRQVADGIPADRIVIAGFSQGGAIAQTTALRHAERLAGLVALSTYLPLSESLAKEGTEANKTLPFLMAHGTYDPMLPLAIGEWSRDRLRELGYAIDWHAYPMAHEVCAEEIEVIGAFLRHALG
jgi:phospholipase/carboxylesterase